MVHSVVRWVVKRYSTLLCYTKLVKSCRRRVHFSDLQLSVAHFLLLTTDALGQDYIFTGNLNLAPIATISLIFLLQLMEYLFY